MGMSLQSNNKDVIYHSPDVNKISYSTGQLLAKARMAKRPIVVVEGKDDIPIYQKIARKIDKKVEIRAIETIKGYTEGCDQVVKLITDIQDKIDEAPINQRYLRGVIDRDARFFRGQDLSHLKCLLILKYYSYESHFVTEKHAEYLLNSLLVSNDDINDKVICFIMSDVKKVYEELYYFSLEALKNACETDYDAIIGYGFSEGKVTKQASKATLLADVMRKKEQLDDFAHQKQLSFNDLYKIVKGKWLLSAFVQSVYFKIQDLHSKCSQKALDGLKMCQYCEIGKNTQCLWKIKRHHSLQIAETIVLDYLDDTELDYIYADLQTLA